MAKKLPKGRQKHFGLTFIKYLDTNWLNNDHYPRKDWNFYGHTGVTTNNFGEGYNYKIGHHSNLGKHPNPYLLGGVIIDELLVGLDDAMSVRAGNPNIKGSKANKIRHRERKQNLMNNIEKRGQGLLVST